MRTVGTIPIETETDKQLRYVFEANDEQTRFRKMYLFLPYKGVSNDRAVVPPWLDYRFDSKTTASYYRWKATRQAFAVLSDRLHSYQIRLAPQAQRGVLFTFASITVLFAFADHETHDPDNVAAKWLIDALCSADILLDDAGSYISLSLRSLDGVDPAQEGTYCTIESVDKRTSEWIAQGIIQSTMSDDVIIQ